MVGSRPREARQFSFVPDLTMEDGEGFDGDISMAILDAKGILNPESKHINAGTVNVFVNGLMPQDTSLGEAFSTSKLQF